MENYKVYMHIFPNGKVYIGITKDKPNRRWRNGTNYKHNQYLTRAVKKYKWENIEHLILFEGLTKTAAEQKEIELILKYNSTNREKGYNIENGGNSRTKVTDEIRKKMSKNHGRYYGKDNYFYGKHHTQETKNKMKEKWHEDENKYKKRIDNLQKHRYNFPKRKIICTTTNELFESVREAANKYNLKETHISRVCRGKRNKTGGLHFEYID